MGQQGTSQWTTTLLAVTDSERTQGLSRSTIVFVM